MFTCFRHFASAMAFPLALVLAIPGAAEDNLYLPSPRQSIVQSFAPLIEKTAPAVVNIYTRSIVKSGSATRQLDGSAFWRLFRDTLLFGYGQDRIANALGSGVIVTADGIIVTNHHVVADADGVSVALSDGSVYDAEILVSDKRTDIAVLRIKAGTPLPFISLGDSDSLRVGDQVIAIGNPFGLGQTVTSGIVSALARTSFGIGDFRFFIQTDAAINPGNSGGAQIDLDGNLVGINTAIYSTSGGSQGLGFAIPSNMILPIIASAVKGQPLVHPWIGISGRRIPPQAVGQLGLSNSHGVLVVEVHAAGPAARAGFVPGDVILALDGIAVNDPEALRYRVAMREPDTTIHLTAIRSGRQYEIPVTVVAPPAVPPPDETKLTGLSPFRGARIASLSPALAEEIGADSGITGVVVLDVGQSSAAARLGLRAGDIIRGLIRGLDDQAIASVPQVLNYRVKPFSPWRMFVTRAGKNVAIGQPAFVGLTR